MAGKFPFKRVSPLSLKNSLGLSKYEDWNVGIVYESIKNFLKPNFKPRVHWLPKRKNGKIYADPFGVSHNHGVTIFFEESDYLHRKSVISYIELKGTTPVNEPRTALELPIHISYPYIFQHQGETFCVPETAQAGEISLYKCEYFPDRWKKVNTLIDNAAGIDSTLFNYEERWWLICTLAGKDLLSNLHIWHAPDLLGPWRPHHKNPVKSDIRSARPAGAPFISDGYLYRPAQDCSKTYGGRIIINKVTKLTPEQFSEEPASVVEPFRDGPYPDGIHTISAVNDMTLIDGKCFKLKLTAALRSLIQKLR
jgi:hypothetical protein